MQCVPSLVQESHKCLLDLPASKFLLEDPGRHRSPTPHLPAWDNELPRNSNPWGFPQPKGQLEIFLANRHLARKGFPFYYRNGGSGRWHSWHWRCCTFAVQLHRHPAERGQGHSWWHSPVWHCSVPLLWQHCTESNRQGTHSTSSFYSRGKVSSFSQHLVSIVHFFDWFSSWTNPGNTVRKESQHIQRCCCSMSWAGR